MTLPRYYAMKDHWRRFPRPEWLIASYMGFKPKAIPQEIQRGSTTRARPARVAPPPSGAMMTLFNSLGGKPGQTVVLST